jgi:tetratricopeptide (TPR) repeat protein
MLTRQAIRHARRCLHAPQRRHAGTFANLPTGPKILAFALIGAGGGGLGLGIYHYNTLPVSPYPDEVTKHLRKALYYEGAGADAKQAVQHYLDALEEATKLGLDQTSDKMTGLKIKIAGVYEQADRLDSAIRVYSGLLSEIKASLRVTQIEEDRLRLLRRAIGTSVKIGELSAQVPGYKEGAEAALTWALETALKETASRAQGGDAQWLGHDEMSSLFERVGHFYYSEGKAALALPLFLKALESQAGQPTCRTVMLMNNVASALSSQSQQLQVQENAKLWAQRARDLKVSGQSAEEQAECDYGKQMALFNLGRIAEELKQPEEARAAYTEVARKSRSLAHGGAIELSREAASALKRIS